MNYSTKSNKGIDKTNFVFSLYSKLQMLTNTLRFCLHCKYVHYKIHLSIKHTVFQSVRNHCITFLVVIHTNWNSFYKLTLETTIFGLIMMAKTSAIESDIIFRDSAKWSGQLNWAAVTLRGSQDLKMKFSRPLVTVFKSKIVILELRLQSAYRMISNWCDQYLFQSNSKEINISSFRNSWRCSSFNSSYRGPSRTPPPFGKTHHICPTQVKQKEKNIEGPFKRETRAFAKTPTP